MRAKLESGASFSFVWLTILIILLIPIFALNQKLPKKKIITVFMQYLTIYKFQNLFFVSF